MDRNLDPRGEEKREREREREKKRKKRGGSGSLEAMRTLHSKLSASSEIDPDQ